MGTATSTNAFLTWFAEWGQVAYVGVQVLFWAAIAAAAIIIALQYKRFVSYKVGHVKPAMAPEASAIAPEAEAIAD